MTTTTETGMAQTQNSNTSNIISNTHSTPAAIATPINMNNTINNHSIGSVGTLSGTPAPTTPCTNGIESSVKVKRSRRKRLAHKSKQTTGYIIYASEIRKDIIKKYPNREFGDISKIVGVEWKNLPQETKAEYEKRAQALNVKYKALAAQSQQMQATQKHRHNSADSSVHYGSSSCNSPYQVGSDSQTQFSLPDHNQTLDHHQNGYPSSAYQNHNSSSSNNFNHSFNQRSTLPSPDNASQQSSDVHSYHHHTQQQQQTGSSQPGFICVTNNTTLGGIQQFKQNNIIYRRPVGVRLRPKDTYTQTEPVKWIDRSKSTDGLAKKPLQFSQKFIEYLANKVNQDLNNGNSTDDNSTSAANTS